MWIALLASLIFFSWGQFYYLPLMLVLIILNFYSGKWIEKNRDNNPIKARYLLISACSINLLILLFFKAIAVYGNNWNFLPGDFLTFVTSNPLPLGLSYITFQVISYLIDIYKDMSDSEKSFINFSLYILLFPKILVGPITRYRNLAGQLFKREADGAQVANGIRRFITGLAKKVLIADTIARTINPAFNLNSPDYSTAIAWFVLFGYAIQLYFDFSGYTDMAVGIGQIMGFKFVENFNYPYISRNITDFWRRWHISLSSWFRDYVFYPLEFMRAQIPIFHTQQVNIFIVFLLTGLWHGLTINYLIWGGIHGLALVFEMKFLKKLKGTWVPPPTSLYAKRGVKRLGVFSHPLHRLCASIFCAPGRLATRDYPSALFGDAALTHYRSFGMDCSGRRYPAFYACSALFTESMEPGPAPVTRLLAPLGK